MKNYSYKTKGTCAREINFAIEDGSSMTSTSSAAARAIRWPSGNSLKIRMPSVRLIS